MRRHLSSVTPSAKAENQLPPPVALLSAAIATAPFAFNQLDTPPAAAHAGTALGGGSLAPRACAQPLSRTARGRRELRRLNLPPSVLSPPRLLPAGEVFPESARFLRRQVKFHVPLFFLVRKVSWRFPWASLLLVVGVPRWEKTVFSRDFRVLTEGSEL